MGYWATGLLGYVCPFVRLSVCPFVINVAFLLDDDEHLRLLL